MLLTKDKEELLNRRHGSGHSRISCLYYHTVKGIIDAIPTESCLYLLTPHWTRLININNHRYPSMQCSF